MTRFYLFERVGGTNPHGIGTVLVLDSDTMKGTLVISTRSLAPAMGHDFLLKSDSECFLVEDMAACPVCGVQPPANVPPHLYWIRLQRVSSF